MDRLSPVDRSRVMSTIRGKDTKPELLVRRLVHGMGYRFRLHRRTLPGSPDIVLPRHRKAIFVHGCFWHRHTCHRGRSIPVTRTVFWSKKFESNKKRDARVRRQLRAQGWKVAVVWECQTTAARQSTLADHIRRFLREH